MVDQRKTKHETERIWDAVTLQITYDQGKYSIGDKVIVRGLDTGLVEEFLGQADNGENL